MKTVVVTVPLRPGLDRGHIRAGVGLGEGETADHISAGQSRYPCPLLGFIAERLQGKALSLHEEKGGQFYGVWRTLGISLLILPVSVILLFVTHVVMLVEPEVKDIEVYVTSPEVVKMGEPFEIHVNIRNEADYQQNLLSIQVTDDYLQGIVIERLKSTI